jgi:hypothetical protein
MLSERLFRDARTQAHPDARPLMELIFFTLGRIDKSQLTRRKWQKPDQRYETQWKWVQKYARSLDDGSGLRLRTSAQARFIVTRSAVTLRA